MSKDFFVINEQFLEYDCGNQSLMRLYKNTDKEKYNRVFDYYSEKYELYQQTNLNYNLFSTFIADDEIIYIYYSEFDSTLRIICDPNMSLYQKAMKPCEKKCSSSLFQFEVDHSLIDCGMCYIVKCADNSFFIVDSAHTYSVNDYKRLHDFLRKLTPDNEKIIISGWFFSHGHSDHITQFLNFIDVDFSDVVIEGIYYNFVPSNHKNSDNWMYSEKKLMDYFEALMQKLDNIPKYNLHSGERFYIKNLQFDVLCTHEDVFPDSLENFNDSSTVIMMTVEGSKIFLPGDAGIVESDILTSRFSEYLKADICQVAHHGHFGTSDLFYKLVNASVLLFPSTQIMFDGDYKEREINRNAIKNCDKYFIASNGTVEIKLPYNKDEKIIEYPDETFENFEGIHSLWGYEYTDERKESLYKEFLLRKERKI